MPDDYYDLENNVTGSYMPMVDKDNKNDLPTAQDILEGWSDSLWNKDDNDNGTAVVNPLNEYLTDLITWMNNSNLEELSDWLSTPEPPTTLPITATTTRYNWESTDAFFTGPNNTFDCNNPPPDIVFIPELCMFSNDTADDRDGGF